MSFDRKDNAHTVFENEDLDRVFANHSDLKIYFETVKNVIKIDRVRNGKRSVNNYLVINCDEPYVDKVLKVIEEGESAKENE